MIKHEGRLVGILGTVIIHIIAGIIFMSFQLKSLHKDTSEMFEVEFAPAEENSDEQKLIELPLTSVEKVLQDDEEMLNIARNLANRSVERINPDDYIDMVKEELIKSGKLSTNNYIDEQKRNNEIKKDENLAYEDNSETDSTNNKADESQEMAANYKGPTRIYYDLTGRIHTYLPIPIYLCKGSGKVVLSIEVNQRGGIDKAMVVASQSTTTDPCLIETAVKTALISRFNTDISSPKIQTGTLTYHFVAQ